MNDIMLTIVGNVADEIKMRFTGEGTPVASFRLAHNTRYFNRDTNTWTDGGSAFFTVSCWRSLGRNVAYSLRKGMPVIVTGRLRQREFERERDGVVVRTVYSDIEAVAVGPDLARGVTTFERTKGKEVVLQEERALADVLGAESVAGGSGAADGPEAPATQAPAA